MARTRKKNDIAKLILDLIQSEEGGQAMLAVRLGVSPSSLARWRNGKTRPQPDVERLIRSLAAKRGIIAQADDQLQLFKPATPSQEAEIRAALVRTFRQVRELLYSVGRLSSRHEALDEIAKLLFAHVMSADTGGNGICRSNIPEARNSAKALKSFVKEQFRMHLPVSLSHDLTPADFSLRLKETETTLADGLVECFDQLSSSMAIQHIKNVGSADLINDTFGQFLVDSFGDEKELGQYLTPPEVVRFMVELGLDSLTGDRLDSLCSTSETAAGIVLDPSCGVGSFLAETMRRLCHRVRDQHGSQELGSWISRTLGHALVGLDKSERMIRLALTNLALFGAPMANLHLGNALDRVGDDANVNEGLNGTAWLILTNPPFGAPFARHELHGYRLVTEWSNGNGGTIDSELLFFERYFDWLAPGGVLVTVVPDSILTNQGLFSNVRRGIAEQVELLSVISLPPVTFAAAGTSTKTSVIHLRKRAIPKIAKTKVFFAVCNDVGFDVTTRGSQRSRVPSEGNDLEVIIRELRGEIAVTHGSHQEFSPKSSRWDATFNVGLPANVQERLEQPRSGDIRVEHVAELVNERTNPIRFGDGEFDYIEISHIDAATCSVRSKRVLCRRNRSRVGVLILGLGEEGN